MIVGVWWSSRFDSFRTEIVAMAMQLVTWEFVMRLGSTLMLEGYPFYANGWNSYWLMVVASEVSTRPRVDTIMRDGAALGLTVCRTWAFNDGTDLALQISPGKYDEKVFQGLDYAIYQAQRNGVRLLLSFVNNWHDYGGKAKYVAWAEAEGEDVGDEDDFFRNAKCRQYYRNHVKAVLTRVNTITGVAYRDDPTIFGWELMNEPHCKSDSSGETLQRWIGEMAAYVKTLDNKHLLTVGTEGYYASDSIGCSSSNPDNYCGTMGSDFIRDHQSPHLDFATVHAYPDQWLSTEDYDERVEFFDRWVRAHIVDAERILRMPVLFSEFGLSDKNPGFTEAKLEAFYSVVYDHSYESALNQGAGAGALMWQLLPAEMSDWNDGYAIEGSCGSSICKMMSLQSARLKALHKPVCIADTGPHVDFYGNRTSPNPHMVSSFSQQGLNQIFT